MLFRRIVAVTVICVSAMVLGACTRVQDGTEGISMRFGVIDEQPLGSGLYWVIPVVRDVEVWDVKTQRRSVSLDIPSGEGLIVRMESTVLYRFLNVIKLKKEIGTQAEVVHKVLDSTLINTFREVIGKLKVEEVITSQEKLTTMVIDSLRESMADRGVTVENLMITRLELPVKFKDAIERKLEQEQKALQKRFELDQAKKDAEIEVARARGAAQAQEIVRSTLSTEYLQYLWIKTLNDHPNVIYVATEANMPMFRSTAPAMKPPVSGQN